MPVTQSPRPADGGFRSGRLASRAAFALAAGILAFGLGSCQLQPRPKHLRACTMDYRPVCAFKDGKRQVFPNRCSAEAEGASGVTPGECRR